MDLLAYLLSPVISTAIILGVVFLIGFALNVLTNRTETGETIKNKTPWMGWTEDTEKPYFGFQTTTAN